MTNPDNIVRVRARTGGRASVYEANGWCQAYTSGLLEGNGVLQNTSADMNVLVGGSASKPDVVLAENSAGYKIALDLVGQQAVAVTAPASNSRISAIVAYTDDLSLSTTEDTVTGSPASCGLIVVNGTTASTPSNPTDAQIRTAITADGATGSQAAYCVIATILVANNTTIITNNEITINKAQVPTTKVGFDPTVTTLSTEKTLSAASSTTFTDFDSHQITVSGLYSLELDFTGGSTATTKARQVARCLINSNVFITVGQWSITAWSGNNFCEGNKSVVVWLNAGDTLKTQGNTQNAGGNLTINLRIQRIY